MPFDSTGDTPMTRLQQLRLATVAVWMLSSAASAQTSADVSADAPTPGDGAALAQRIDELEARVARAEAIRAIKRLQHAYGHYVEFGLWQDFADLFGDAAVAHYLPGGLGREAIRELFLEQVGQGQLGLANGRLYPHFVLQPVVTIARDGKSAHGRWHLLTLLGGYGGNASWVGSLYDNDYVLEDGVWKIAELRTYTQFSGAYASGWTNPRPPDAAPAPDAPCENYLISDCSIPFRYDAAQAGAPLGVPVGGVPVGGASVGGSAVSDLDQLGGRVAGLDRRVARLVDESEVINLQHAYGYYVDRKLWDDVADLFAPDGTMELGLQGVYRGQASIRRALDQFGPQGIAAGELNDHLQLEMIVTVAADGNTARARGVDLALWGTENGGESRSEWRESVFENIYRKENGVWKIAAMHLYPRFATDYALGWAKDARPAPVASETFPPDEAPTTTHAVYPEFYTPPFHFTNPVTGALPQYGGGETPRAASTVSAADRERTGASATADPARAPANTSFDSIGAIAARLVATQRRLELAIGHDAVENIVDAYSFYMDEFDRSGANGLFADNGSRTVTNIEVAGGREPILAVINEPYAGGGRKRGMLAIHQTAQPVIQVSSDGTSATFRLRLFEAGGRIAEEGAWIAGIYQGEAVVENGVWKLRRLAIDYTWAADYSTGWSSAAPFARIAAIPFLYDNPVSGRARPAAAD
jgi:hypothetical protein